MNVLEELLHYLGIPVGGCLDKCYISSTLTFYLMGKELSGELSSTDLVAVGQDHSFALNHYLSLFHTFK